MMSARKLLELANEIAPPARTDNEPDERWFDAIAKATTSDLVGLAGLLNSEPGNPAAKRKALREAVMGEIERKNAVLLAETVTKLDTATAKLNSRMFWLTVVGVVLAVVQVVVPLMQN